MRISASYFSRLKFLTFVPAVCIVCAGLWSGAALAQPAAAPHGSKETKEDIARHRAMAAAHEAAAKCLESGKKDDVCEKELAASCKGLAIGKYCGMKHVH